MERKIHNCTFLKNARTNPEHVQSDHSDPHYSDNNIVIARRKIHQPDQLFHTHQFFEFDIILNGAGMNVTPDGSTPFRKGTLIFQSPADMHRFIITENPPLEVLNIEFSGECEQTILNTFHTLHSFTLPLPGEVLSMICREAEDILCSVVSPSIQLFAMGAALKIIAAVSNVLHASDVCPADSRTDKNVLDALLYIHRNYSKKLTAEDVARHVGFSPNYLSALIKLQTGRSFKQYLLDVRLENAYRLISEKNQSVKSVCAAVGYSSYPNFHYAFLEKFGVCPGELQKFSYDDMLRQYRKAKKR